MNKRRLFSITQSLNHLITAWWLFPGTAWACPLCKDALANAGDAMAVARAQYGYAMTIALLLGVPALLVAGTAAVIVRSARRRIDTRKRSG